MFENIKKIFKRNWKKDSQKSNNSKDAAKERLHLVLMQDRANVSADFLDLMRKEIVEVIKKYIDIDEEAMDVRLTTETNEEGTQSAPALYANIPIINIKDETRQLSKTNQDKKIISQIEKKKDEQNENKENINKENEEKKEKVEIKEEDKTEHQNDKEAEVIVEEPENKEDQNENNKDNDNKENEETTPKQENKI